MNSVKLTCFRTEDPDIAEIAFRLTLIRHHNPEKAERIIRSALNQTEHETNKILEGVSNGKNKKDKATD